MNIQKVLKECDDQAAQIEENRGKAYAEIAVKLNYLDREKQKVLKIELWRMITGQSLQDAVDSMKKYNAY